ncbi:MAG: alpha-fucosidase [Clostridiales bacterium]|nr:alpha-fucosidase [Clostridiales bacterium]
MKEFLKTAAAVKPSQRQLDWFDVGFYAFIHFGVNTFTDREWGLGNEDEGIFNPQKLNCDQWVAAAKSAGMKGLILTAKHHDGFCLWPSKFTEHSVKNSPIKRDIVREAADACRRGGIKFGFYLSPWDRNSKYYGTEEYNDYFCNQLTELLTGYGDIFCVWFDGACGEGPNGKKQVYDFDRYIKLIRQYQPGAVIFNDAGPDVRWVGNEAGKARYAEWAVVPCELCFRSQVQTGPAPMAELGSLEYMYNTDKDIGSVNNIMYSKGLAFTPSEIDMSIRPGWFWHEYEEPHSLERLFRTWLTSYGANACLNLNLPPNRDGFIDERDVKRLKELGELIKKEFGSPIKANVKKAGDTPVTQPKYEITFETDVRDIKYVEIMEDIAKGQRIETFRIIADTQSGAQYPLYQGTCVGNRKICVLKDPFEDQNPLLRDKEDSFKKLTVFVTSARDEVFIKGIKVY